MADYLSRRTPEALIGEAYKMESATEDVTVAKGEEIDFSKIKEISAAEILKINTVNLQELAESQKSCKEVQNCRQGNHSTSLAFEEVLSMVSKCYARYRGPRKSQLFR